METLKNYLSNAEHYLYKDDSPGGAKRQREQFLSNCQKFGLDKEFPKLVENDPEWRELAENKLVYFFEDSLRDPLKRGLNPELRLICAEMGTAPIIKLLRHEKD